jgi:hypothetical protein
MPPIFFLRNYNYSYNETCIYHGNTLYKLRLFTHKVFSIINTLFPPFHETIYVGRVKLFAEASQLFMHAVFQLARKTASSECTTQTAKTRKSEGAKSGL